MRVFVTNMGCKLNQAESEQLSRQFLAAGHEIVGALADCDLHVINSCTVTHVAAREARKLARRGGRLEGGIRTVLTGCYATEQQVEAARLAGVDLVVPNPEKDRLVERVHEAMPDCVPASPAELAVPYVPLDFGHARAMVKVGDGCNMRCSFCIIPFTRGRESYRPVPEVVREVRRLVAGGYREVVMTGVQISSYRWEGRRLFDLARALLAETSVERLRLTSIAPWDFDDRLLELFEDRRLCRQVHMSLQSGSCSVLRRMRRPYSPAAYRDVCDRLRRHLPEVAITTDVIVGFPGETQAEHEASLDFVRQMGFARVHTFPYSSRPGTAAAGLPGAVDPAEQRRRMKEMLALGEEAEQAFWRAQLGRRCEVLWESSRHGVWQGLTGNYVRVTMAGGPELEGAVTPVRLVRVGPAGVVAEPAHAPDFAEVAAG